VALPDVVYWSVVLLTFTVFVLLTFDELLVSVFATLTDFVPVWLTFVDAGAAAGTDAGVDATVFTLTFAPAV
jgi:hypothetical protein